MIKNEQDKTGEKMPKTITFNAQWQLSTQNDTLNAILNDTFIRFIDTMKSTGVKSQENRINGRKVYRIQQENRTFYPNMAV